jgi:arylsulfatase A-like enzyme
MDHTHVVFTSDHGEMLGDHGCWTKGVFYEAALRVPLLMAGPGIAAGARSDALVELVDLNPTILDWAGAPRLENTDARSLVPLLSGQTGAIHAETVAQLRSGRCLRTHDWKLIQHAGGGQELYDLRNDPNELVNVADTQPGIAAGLAHRMVRRFLEGECAR